MKFTDSYTVRLDISELPDKGYLYFTLTAESEAELTGGSYLADTNNDNPVKIGLVICTYKRETFVKNNLKRLLAGIAAEPEWGNVLHVFVIDNAKTLELPENEYYTVVPNKNLGGSGRVHPRDHRGVQRSFVHAFSADGRRYPFRIRNAQTHRLFVAGAFR